MTPMTTEQQRAAYAIQARLAHIARASRSRYMPHQGPRECARRVAQAERLVYAQSARHYEAIAQAGVSF